MSSVMDKAKVSGIVAIFTVLIAMFSGFPGVSALFVSLGTFIFTLMIQYGAVKFKIAGSALFISFISWLFTHGGSFK